MSAREFLQRNINNDLMKLTQFAKLIWPYFEKIFFVNRESLELFNAD